MVFFVLRVYEIIFLKEIHINFFFVRFMQDTFKKLKDAIFMDVKFRISFSFYNKVLIFFSESQQ